MKTQIDKNIPPPTSGGLRAQYPFAEMDVGNSFRVEGLVKGMHARNEAYKYGRTTGKKFTGRTDGDGIRIWRIK